MAFAATYSRPASCVRNPRKVLDSIVMMEKGALMSACIDGEGEGFGHKISIQTVSIVRAAEAVKRVYRVDTDRPVSTCDLTIYLPMLIIIVDLACVPCP
jgi:hypothetical protein